MTSTYVTICNLVHATARAASLLLLSALAGCERVPTPNLVEAPAAAGASLPRLSTDPEGNAWLSWVEPAGTGHALRYARLEAGGWGPAATAAAGDDWFLNWADFPSVVHLGSGLMAAHWLQKVDGGPYAYHVRMSVSADAGRHWSEPVLPHGDHSATEHGFVSLFPLGPGVGAAWLDGRHTGPDGHDHGGAARQEQAGHGSGAMTLRVGGVAIDGTALPDVELDDMTCDCCPTAAARVPDGVVLLYRNRTPDEIRDIYSVRLGPDGWSAPAPVARDGWHMPACPVNGPAVAAHGRHLAAAWFTATGGVPQVRAAFSADGGRSWGSPVEVAAGDTLGRVAVVMDGPDSAVVSWLGHTERQAEIRYRRLHRSGHSGRVLTLAATSEARSSGFPQLAVAGDRLLFAWSVVGEPGAIHTALVPLP